MLQRNPALLIALGLGACTVSDPRYGSGPLEMTPGLQAAFERYLELPNPGAFAVALDGRSIGASYCPDGRCRGNEGTIALRGCERRSEDAQCRIYAVRERVVWDFAAPPPAR